MTNKEPLEDWEQELMGEEWEDDGVVLPPSGARTSIQSVRFQRDELTRIRDAAKDAGLTTSTFIRRAVTRELVRSDALDTDPGAIGERTAEDLERAAAVVREMSKQLPKRKTTARSQA